MDCVGQAGGYSSRLFARLGKRTGYIGLVGDDSGGRLVRDTLARDSINLTGLFGDADGTNRSINLVYRDGRRKNFFDGRGSMTLQPNLALCRGVLAWTRLCPLLDRALVPPAAADRARARRGDRRRSPGRGDCGRPYRQDFVDGADILLLSGVNHPEPAPVIAAYHRRNPRAICVVGMGARGAVLDTADGVRWFGPVAHDRPVVDSNGAGDSLAVGFVTSYRRAVRGAARPAELASVVRSERATRDSQRPGCA